MKIRQTTPERLVLEDRPIVIAIALAAMTLSFVGAGLAMLLQSRWEGLLFGVFGGGFAAVFLVIFVRRTIVFLDRGAGVVLIREATLLGQTEVTHPLAAVRGVTVQSSRTGKGGTTYRPALLMADGSDLPLRRIYVSGRGAARAAEAVTRWLRAEAPDA